MQADTEKDTHINIRLPREKLNLFKALAATKGTSMAAILRDHIDRELETLSSII